MSAAPLSRHLVRAKDLADRSYAEPLTVADLAAAAGLSPAYFARAFHRAFGETPHRYLLSRRLERAARLLTTTDWPVARVCTSVGLSSIGSFTTSFRRTFGCTPTEYRAKFPSPAHRMRIPECIYRTYGRPRVRSFREDAAPSEAPS